MVTSWAVESFRSHPPALACALACAAARRSAPNGTPWAPGGQPAPPWSCPWTGKSLVPGATPALLHWPSCLQFLINFSYSSFQAPVVHFIFLLVLKYLITEVQMTSLIGSALASGGSLWEPDGASSYLTWCSFCCLLMPGHPCTTTPISPPPGSPGYQSLPTYTQYSASVSEQQNERWMHSSNGKFK